MPFFIDLPNGVSVNIDLISEIEPQSDGTVSVVTASGKTYATGMSWTAFMRRFDELRKEALDGGQRMSYLGKL